MEPIVTGVTKINGPVAFHILRSPNNIVVFHLYGDYHHSTSQGCRAGKTLRLTRKGDDLTPESIAAKDATTIDITASLYLTLRYNNLMKIRTILLVERPLDIEVRKTLMEEEVSKDGWLTDVTKLIRQSALLQPICTVEASDIRQNYSSGTLDILTHIGMVELPTVMKEGQDYIMALFNIINIVFRHYENLFDAMCNMDNLDKLRNIIDEVGDLRKSPARDRCLESLHSMLKVEPLVINGRTRRGHKIAVALEQLRAYSNDTRSIANANLRYIKSKYLALKSDLDQASILTEISSSIRSYSDSDEVVQAVLDSLLESLIITFVKMAALFMDIYTITKAFASRSTTKIIFAGNAHIDRYIDLLKDVHNYSHIVNETNVVQFFDDEEQKMVDEYTRCIQLDTLPRYLDFNNMKSIVYKQ